MGRAIADSLPMALGVAISPLPIAAVIILLMTRRARSNAPAFLLGWAAGILTVGTIVFAVPLSQSTDGELTRLAGIVRVILGGALLMVAAWQWHDRPARDARTETPWFLAKLDDFGIGMSFFLGVGFAAVNPKNLLLDASGAAAIDAVVPDMSTRMACLLIFTVISSLSVALPIGAYLVIGRRAERTLQAWKTRLVANRAIVGVALPLVLGLLMFGRGLKILAG